MATPSRTNAASTPKNNLIGTPTRLISSPRPAHSGASGRPLSAKSPAVKTPAAIGHSRTPSHPTTTPLAVPGISDDLLAFSSPAAALIASLSGQGLTPLTNGQDGLGVSTNLHPGPGSDAPTTRDLEADKLSRLQEVVDNLNTKVAGRGVTREGVERLAHINGFSLYWDDDIFSMAGNCVDLEIVFDHVFRDSVKDVNLKINTSGEEEQQIDASNILKRDLAQISSQDNGNTPWKGIEDFATNLAKLKQLDHLSNNVNCFGAVAGLYQTFRTIWDEEKKRMTWRNGLRQLCHGAAGQPKMNADGKLGLTLDYWIEKQELQDEISREREASSEVIDREEQNRTSLWSARISCETGYPSITKAQEWLSPEALITDSEEDVPRDGHENIYKPAWQDPSAVGAKDDPNAMTDKVEAILEPSNVRFLCDLTPSVFIPLNAVAALNSHSLTIQIDQGKVIPYQQSLNSTRKSPPATPPTDGFVLRWIKNLIMFDKQGQPKKSRHSYAIYSAATLWCYPVEKMSFNHPRQLVDALPVLRQYVLLWTLLRKLVTSDSPVAEKPEMAHPRSSPPKKEKRSNRMKTGSHSYARRAQLDELLNPGHQKSPEPDSDSPLSIDVSLDLITEPSKAKLAVIIPSARAPFFTKVAVEIGLNAELRVTAVEGMSTDHLDKMTRVLALSEDLGVLVEWILERLRDKAGKVG